MLAPSLSFHDEILENQKFFVVNKVKDYPKIHVLNKKVDAHSKKLCIKGGRDSKLNYHQPGAPEDIGTCPHYIL